MSAATLLAGVDQVFGERAENAVAPGEDLADPARVLAGRLDDAAGGGIDNGGDTAGLSIEGIARTCRLLHRGSENMSTIVDLRANVSHQGYLYRPVRF